MGIQIEIPSTLSKNLATGWRKKLQLHTLSMKKQHVFVRQLSGVNFAPRTANIHMLSIQLSRHGRQQNHFFQKDILSSWACPELSRGSGSSVIVAFFIMHPLIWVNGTRVGSVRSQAVRKTSSSSSVFWFCSEWREALSVTWQIQLKTYLK